MKTKQSNPMHHPNPYSKCMHRLQSYAAINPSSFKGSDTCNLKFFIQPKESGVPPNILAVRLSTLSFRPFNNSQGKSLGCLALLHNSSVHTVKPISQKLEQTNQINISKVLCNSSECTQVFKIISIIILLISYCIEPAIRIRGKKVLGIIPI